MIKDGHVYSEKSAGCSVSAIYWAASLAGTMAAAVAAVQTILIAGHAIFICAAPLATYDHVVTQFAQSTIGTDGKDGWTTPTIARLHYRGRA
jgi:fumarate reductase subunit D